VGNGNIDVGTKPQTREPEQPIIERLVSGALAGQRLDARVGKGDTIKRCGAMSEQSADSGRGNEQVPQQLLHLVGCREADIRARWLGSRRR
jgi:hypothetical protein